mmetsp:Transcript_22621/g.57682  ORF Transcript_22621/g.57682 Transcript_22621/m.57682 type:complete len:100 (-) Transcript_22621:208-507(-)
MKEKEAIRRKRKGKTMTDVSIDAVSGFFSPFAVYSNNSVLEYIQLHPSAMIVRVSLLQSPHCRLLSCIVLVQNEAARKEVRSCECKPFEERCEAEAKRD